MLHQYQLEPSPKPELDGTNRFKIKNCACGKSNDDGKFVPLKGFQDRGYCHSCANWFSIGNHDCPSCKSPKSFNRYLNTATNEYVADEVGKCIICEYHYSPKSFYDNNNKEVKAPHVRKKSVLRPSLASLNSLPAQVAHYIPQEVLRHSLVDYSNNNFVKYLRALVGAPAANEAISRYFIGTSHHWAGSTIWWYIDPGGKVNYGKIMLYKIQNSPDAVISKDCKRDKLKNNHVVNALEKECTQKGETVPQWILDYQSQASKINCFFGSHLTRKDCSKTIAICESEKTAIIASVYIPEFIWLACGSISNLNEKRMKHIAGRKIVLFPDLNGFERWSAKAKELSHIASIRVSDLLERNVVNESERKAGLDLADYLIRYKPSAFRKPTATTIEPVNVLINQIISAPAETVAGKDFQNYRLLYVITENGKTYDLLFDESGNPVAARNDTVAGLEQMFNKRFQQGLVDGKLCLVNVN